ncbi:MAG: VOC family protein, partial [Clostridiaceae bacterium]|nr:VOC family protein [Clostridiaceae bacterium]
MKFSFDHNNINVLDLEKSIEFYKNALGFVETSRFNAPDDSFTL